ncbi:hypothetical protein FR483_n215R [Paramecium bursaria Chlorella virus FR483]|uniref:Uncharacterized protein n215R n=1 Tax=Paramecium bursaria Chlorella virus FR483 TaxID=399781 RepID=A7J6R9_PBCVF|nr:hypothetical protein FR483_n215R [Paramecium bursaria Chlorella virus FR483]ABT15500.1 hypothetical protein FR483_n215R [Paramecium bursaria Chlorella virus FR483]
MFTARTMHTVLRVFLLRVVISRSNDSRISCISRVRLSPWNFISLLMLDPWSSITILATSISFAMLLPCLSISLGMRPICAGNPMIVFIYLCVYYFTYVFTYMTFVDINLYRRFGVCSLVVILDIDVRQLYNR